MDISVFTDKNSIPDDHALQQQLKAAYPLWKEIEDAVMQLYPKGIAEWNYPGAKYGWSFRIKDKKRAIIYFLPREESFMVAFVFGNKAVEQVMQSSVPDFIKKELQEARVYAEGRGIRIAVTDKQMVSSVMTLVQIKLAN